MSNPQNLADQLAWCNTTRHYLEDLENDIKHTTIQFYRTVEMLGQSQYLLELLHRLEPVRDEFNRRAEATCRHIEDSHIEYMNQQSDAISEQLSHILNLPKHHF